jgi:hypothetical protein
MTGERPCYGFTDPNTGEHFEVELFVAVMGASNFTYAEVTALKGAAVGGLDCQPRAAGRVLASVPRDSPRTS